MATTDNWYSVLDSTRNDLVFENRNKQYGAYVIRKENHRVLVKSLMYTLSGFFLIFSIPSILKLMSKPEKIIPAKIDGAVVCAYPFIVPPEIQKQKVHVQPPQTKQFVDPHAAVVKPTTEKPSSNDELNNSELSTVTTKGIAPVDPPATVPSGGETAEATEKVRMWAEQMPEFPGGMDKLSPYLVSNIKFSPIARENNISGKVYISWVIDIDGNVTNVKVEHGVNPLLDEEAIRVVKSMPRWKPGKQNGMSVLVKLVMPIVFTLK